MKPSMNITSTTEHARLLDRHYRQNVAGIASVEFLWGLGLPVVIESTFLQLFLKSLGASSTAVGLIPTLFFIGCSVFALFSSYITEDLRFKRGPVILLHLISGLSLLLLGGFLLVVEEERWMLTFFFSCYGLFTICMGMTLPVWLNYLVQIFSEERSVAGLAYMMIASNVAKLISSLFLVQLVERFAFSRTASALTFIGVGVLFATGSLLFILTREVPRIVAVPSKKKDHFPTYLVKTLRKILSDRNFLFFLGGDTEYFILVTVISFYANYATIHCGVSPAMAAGGFVMSLYLGAIVSNVLCGTMGMLSLKNKFIASKLLALTAVSILIFSRSTAVFLMVSALFGTSRGIRNVAYAPAVKKISGLSDSTGYFAVAPILTLPFAVTLPLLAGWFLDAFPHLEANAYRLVFAAAGLLLLGSLSSVTLADFRSSPEP